MNKLSHALLTPLSGLLLCSFCPMKSSAMVSQYHESALTKKTLHYKDKDYSEGSSFNVDYPNFGVIGRHATITINTYGTYEKSKNQAYILAYGMMCEPRSQVSQTISFSQSFSYTYSFAYKFSIDSQFANTINSQLQLGLGSITSGSSLSVSAENSLEYTYTFSQSETYTGAIEYNPESVPDGYEYAPCLISTATILSFTYTVYDVYWWGTYESQDSSLVNQKNILLIYQPDSFCLTIAIRPHNSQSRPTLYL